MENNATSSCGFNEYVGYVGLLVSIIVICDSVLTIVTIWRTLQLHTNQYIFIASLAVADIMLSLSFVGSILIRLVSTYSYYEELNIVNNLAYGTLFSFVVSGSLHMSIIAVDRYIRIAHPFYYITNMTTQRTIKILSVTYMLCAINVCCRVIIYRDMKYNTCINIRHSFTYLYLNITVHVICCIVVFICYFKIARISITHKRAAMSRRQQTVHIAGVDVSRSNRDAVMRSVRFFVVVCGTFFILCTPPFVINWVGFYYSVPDVLITILTNFFPLHSLLNFVISCVLNQGFRKALKRTLFDLKTCCIRKCCAPPL